MHAVEVLEVPGAWVALKRTLETGLLDIGAAAAGLLGLPRPLEPDQVPIDVKVVMVGERQHYDALWHGDPDFRALFGIRADFSSDMPMGAGGAAALRRASSRGSASARACRPPTAGAIGALVEDGIARAGRRNRVSTSFGDTPVARARGRARGAATSDRPRRRRAGAGRAASGARG